MTIRDARAADAAAIAGIWNHYIQNTAATFNSEPKSDAEVARIIAERSTMLVAVTGGAVTGFATWVQFRGGVGYRYAIENTVLLDSNATGQGTGRALMEALITRARQAGHHTMWAGISGENPAGVAFHARLGFDTIATLPEVGHKFGRWMDLTLMHLRL